MSKKAVKDPRGRKLLGEKRQTHSEAMARRRAKIKEAGLKEITIALPAVLIEMIDTLARNNGLSRASYIQDVLEGKRFVIKRLRDDTEMPGFEEENIRAAIEVVKNDMDRVIYNIDDAEEVTAVIEDDEDELARILEDYNADEYEELL